MVPRDEGKTGDPQRLLTSVGLAQLDTTIDHSWRRRADGRTVDILCFRLGDAQLAQWLEDSFGAGAGPGRAWVTYKNAQDALGISGVPTTWRLSRTKPAGADVERYVLIDDGDPATVWVATCPALDAVAGNGWSA